MVPIFGENPIEVIVEKLFQLDFAQIVTKKLIDNKNLTDDAWVSGPDLAPQKFLLSQ